MRTIRRDATQPAQRRLRAWRDCRAPVPSVFPSAARPDGKTEGTFKPGSEESIRTGRLGTLAVPGRTYPPRAAAQLADLDGDTLRVHGKGPGRVGRGVLDIPSAWR